MSTHNQLNGVTLIAGSTIVRNRFVVTAADGKLDYVTANTVEADGISCHDAVLDDALTIALMLGIAIVESGAAVTRGTQVMSDSTGRCIDLSGSAGRYIQGRALDTAANSGEMIRILLSSHQDVS